MKKIILLILILYCESSFSDTFSIPDIRQLYQSAAVNEDACDKLIHMLDKTTSENNLLFSGYKACATMLRAKYVFNPFTKWSHFYNGKNMLEKTILTDENNIELRYLRFTIQTNVPSFLGYKNEIEADKLFLLRSIKTLSDENLKTSILSFLKKSDYLNIFEKQNL